MNVTPARIPVSISVEQVEGSLQVSLSEQLRLVHGGGQELRVVDLAVAVNVSCAQDLLHVRLLHVEVLADLGHVPLDFIAA